MHATNTGGQAAQLTITVNGSVEGEMAVAPGQEETFVFDLNPADAGTTKTVEVYHGDVAILDEVLEVDCGNFAATPCEPMATTAGSPEQMTTNSMDCVNPCWWAPAALALGVLIGRRRRDGRANVAGIAVGSIAGIFAFITGGAGAIILTGIAALLVAAATKLAGARTRDDESLDDVDTETSESASTTE